jgi:hypothetical protein
VAGRVLAGGFRCSGGAAGLAVQVPKPAADLGRGEPLGWSRAFPGASQVSDSGAGQPELGVGGQDVEQVDRALGTAALAGRFADNDVIRILAHQRDDDATTTRASETHSLQPGTSAWSTFGRTTGDQQ